MATISPEVQANRAPGAASIWKWAGLSEGDTASPIVVPGWGSFVFQVEGAFGGGTIQMHARAASGATFLQLQDSGGSNISFTADGATATELAAYEVKPVVASGTSVNVDVYVLARGAT